MNNRITPILLLLGLAYNTARANPVTSAAKVLAHHGDDVAKIAVHHGDDLAKGAAHYGDDIAKGSMKYGDDVAKLSTKVLPSSTLARTAALCGDEALSAARTACPKVESTLPSIKTIHLPRTLPKGTAGAILATGAATAMVVGTHEVADGAQEMQKSFGKSAKEVAKNHPELRPGIIDSSMKPVTWCMVVAALLLGGAAFYALSPLLKAGRKASASIANRLECERVAVSTEHSDNTSV